jgi:pilus assembly protein Flp/PilA
MRDRTIPPDFHHLMRNTTLKFYLNTQEMRRALRRFLANDNGQDLIEYALVVALIAFAAAAGMTSVATQINAAFTSVGAKVSAYTS